MYLTKIVLNTHSIQARMDIGNPYNLHRTIMSAFPTPLPENERVLFRVEEYRMGEPPVVLVQSRNEPDWDNIEQKFGGYFLKFPLVKTLDKLKFEQGETLRFRVRANPSRRVTYKKTGKNQRISLFSEKDRRDWLVRKGIAGGFSVVEERLSVKDAPYRTVFINKEDETHKATLNMVDYDGFLKVENPQKFLESVQKGIGPAKGLGCGLLSLARSQ